MRRIEVSLKYSNHDVGKHKKNQEAKMNPAQIENGDSFNLVKENLTPFTWQEQAYERLKALYEIGKILASKDDIEKTFPEILSLCATTIPCLTAIVMENRSEKSNTIVWNAENATQEEINLAIENAKESLLCLTNVSAPKLEKENYCILPLSVDQLPIFGILQLEGSLPFSEKDLEFVEALADLIAISVDRRHKTKFEQELRKKEAQESSLKLSRSQTRVSDLKMERDLRERFVALLTHDLRTPLTAIKMSAQLIQHHSEDSKQVLLHAGRINNCVDRADRMISDLLDANRIRSGEKLPLNIEHVELSNLVKKTLDELMMVHGDRFVLKAEKLIVGYWDPGGIRRIVENLCNNAIKYGSPEANVFLLVERQGNKAIIEVKNTGNVISHEDQNFLFQQFRRGRKTIEKGWGIGLTLVRGVAEAHGGEVKVKSEIGTGTIFTVSIPVDSRPFLLH